MSASKHGLTIGKKAYIFIISTLLTAVLGTAAISYLSSAGQIDRFYKSSTLSNARNFASMIDTEFYSKLREVAESDEYQAVRDAAEEADDEDAIQSYLEEKGLWEDYEKNRAILMSYLNNMVVLKYLYVQVIGPPEAVVDMYLMDDTDNPLYETGYYEEREPELYGIDSSGYIEPSISNGDWGHLCSAWAPVYDKDGNVICHVGCDISMDEVVTQRWTFLATAVLGALLFTAIVLAIAVLLINRAVVFPLNSLTKEMKKFKPTENASYDEAGVVQLNIRSRDEIQDIYQGVRTMQTDIIDYLNDMSALQRDNEQAQNDIREKDVKIGEISRAAYKDALTGVGSKTAYINAVSQLNTEISEKEHIEFAVVMVDMNNLKKVNDDHGHKAGDTYIKGCCRLICEVFKHSPVFRIGGDEFVSILRGTDYEERKEKVASLRAAFEKTCSDTGREPWKRYSAAVGIAENASDDSSYELVFKRADQAMYKEKKLFKEQHGSYR